MPIGNVAGVRVSMELIGFRDVQDWIDAEAKHIRFATSVALNRTAKDARDAVSDEIQRVFRQPRRWIVHSPRAKMSTKRDLEAIIGWKDPWGWHAGGSTRGGHILEPHIYGGERGPIGIELHLRRASIIRAGEYVIPSRWLVQRTGGKIGSRWWNRLLSGLGAHPDPSARSSRRTRSGAAWWVNRRVRGVAGAIFYSPRRGQRHLAFVIVRRTRYRRRLDFFGVVRATERRVFERHWDAAWAMAQRVAR